MLGNPVKGGKYALRGLHLLSHKKLRVFVFIPLLINIVMFSVALYLLFNQLPIWISGWLSFLPSFLSFLEYVLYPLFAVTMILVVYYSFSVMANIIAAPFNGILSERVEQMLTGEEISGDGFKELLAIIPSAISREISKLVYYIPRVIGLLIISFIPGLNLLAPFLWFMFGAWMMAIQYCDYPMDNNKVSFKDMLVRLKKQRLTSLGFGALVEVAMMVPFLNLIMMPVAVIGATIYWVEEHRGVLESS